MALQAATSNHRQISRHEPLFDVDPQTGAGIEVFYADRTLETFGRCGPGWFWWSRRRGYAPAGPANGPFHTSYVAYRHALTRMTTADFVNRCFHIASADNLRGSNRPLLGRNSCCFK